MPAPLMQAANAATLVLAATLAGLPPAAQAGGWPGRISAPQPLAALGGATDWINSAPLDASALRGKVVLVDFWTYSCINCLRTLPYLRAWAQKYADHGLVVLGVHAPEFEFERSGRNVRRAVKDLGITYPVAIDGRQALWRAFDNQAWPAFYFLDAQGRVRDQQVGEGRYEQAERTLQQLLREAGQTQVPRDLVQPQGSGTQAAAGPQPPASRETYLGTDQAEGFVSAQGRLLGGQAQAFAPAPRLVNGQWTLSGGWQPGAQALAATQAGSRLSYRFRARDLHLVLGPAVEGQVVRFRVRIDGQAPGADHGSDTDAQGLGQIDGHRLYQLVRQRNGSAERLFEIEFLSPGALAYAFTFG